ncbi:hypothetical protein SAM19_04775 [Brevibacillus laterosporus]|nr:hypothetical protein [Brevibacillus laterosporus]
MRKMVQQAMLPPKERKELWEQILHKWSGAESPEGEFYKMSFSQAAMRRRETIEEKIMEYEQNPFVLNLIEEYGQTVKKAFEDIRNCQKIRLTKIHLLFHYIHMMNNRLGIWPIEEAYLGALLQVGENQDLLQELS